MGAIRRFVNRVRERVPDTPLRYLSALLALAALTGISCVLIYFHAPRNPVLGPVVWFGFLAIILGSAWLGYGPGFNGLRPDIFLRYSPACDKSARHASPTIRSS